jgi:hypothetical protein
MFYNVAMLETVAEDQPVREAGRIARRMRREGKTLLRIAAEMGVCSKTVKNWMKYRPPRNSTPAKRQALTVRRRKFAQGLAQGKTAVRSAMDAGCPTRGAAAKFAHMAKRSPEFVEYFNGLLDAAGLDEETLAAGLKECTQATKIAGIAVNKNTGMITDKLEVPDYQVRHQTLRTCLELRKRLNQRDEDRKPGAEPVHLHLTLEQKQRYERLIGGPLNGDVITLAPESESKAVAAGRGPHFGEDHPQR